MDVISTAAILVGGAVTAVIYKLLADEAKAWLPYLSKRLVKRAVGKLPECEREHFLEEWSADLEETPGDLVKLKVAIGFQKEASHMAAALTGEWPYSVVDAVIDRAIAVAALVILFPHLLLASFFVGPRRHITCTFKRNGDFVHIRRTRTPGVAVTPIRYPKIIRFMYKTRLNTLYEVLQILVAVAKGKARLNFRQDPYVWPRTIKLYLQRSLFE